MDAGYDESREDRLLADIDWPSDGYRLFEISALDVSSVDGWFGGSLSPTHCSCDARCGMSFRASIERYDMPGGGFLNLDLLRRALELREAEFVVLLGEGTFHQLHGGIATNAAFEELTERLTAWSRQYQDIRGEGWTVFVPPSRTLFGVLPSAAMLHFLRAATLPANGMDPLGIGFDRDIWSLRPPVLPDSPRVAGLVELARNRASGRSSWWRRRRRSAGPTSGTGRARAPADRVAGQLVVASPKLGRTLTGRPGCCSIHRGALRAW